MQTKLTSVLEAVALSAGLALVPSCGEEDTDDSTSANPTSTAGCPTGGSAGCPSSAGCPTSTTAGCPTGTTAGCPTEGSTAGCPTGSTGA